MVATSSEAYYHSLLDLIAMFSPLGILWSERTSGTLTNISVDVLFVFRL